MGFSLELCKKGLIKVKNESVAAALDAIVELQQVDLKSNLTSSHTGSNLQVVSYECTSCTYLNPDGKAVCDVCGTAAPQTAYILVKSEAQIKKEAEEIERKKKEEEDELTRVEQERIRVADEE